MKSKTIVIREGKDLQLFGAAKQVELSTAKRSKEYVVYPDDFHGVTPKLVAKEGNEVMAGSPIFYDKSFPQVKFVSPVSGTLKQIVRGEKRKILKFVIEPSSEDTPVVHTLPSLEAENRASVIDVMCEAGVWPMIKQMPYDVIADPGFVPKFINISSADTTPLAADFGFILDKRSEDFQKGLDVLNILAGGNTVHVNIRKDKENSSVFANAKGVQINHVSGPHPSGNNGVQIHHIDPVNKGEAVWFLSPAGVASIGHFFRTGTYDATKTLAIAGESVTETGYVHCLQGAQVKDVLASTAVQENARLISGNVFTGIQTSMDDAIRFYPNELTAIPEGNYSEFLGWIKPSTSKLSLSRTNFAWMSLNKPRHVDTNLHGEERAYVITGEYDKYFPMDIFPMQLVKAAMIQDLELLEKLGIYEVTPEDFALCEFACTSKIEIQDTIREALDMVRKEMS